MYSSGSGLCGVYIKYHEKKATCKMQLHVSFVLFTNTATNQYICIFNEFDVGFGFGCGFGGGGTVFFLSPEVYVSVFVILLLIWKVNNTGIRCAAGYTNTLIHWANTQNFNKLRDGTDLTTQTVGRKVDGPLPLFRPNRERCERTRLKNGNYQVMTPFVNEIKIRTQLLILVWSVP